MFHFGLLVGDSLQEYSKVMDKFYEINRPIHDVFSWYYCIYFSDILVQTYIVLNTCVGCAL